MHLIFRGFDAEFDRALPGRGCELLQAFAEVGNLALVAGFVLGLLVAFVVPDLVRSLVRWVRGRDAA
jgi:hypothetical protein